MFKCFFFFFLANQTSFKDEFLPLTLFIDDQFFEILDSKVLSGTPVQNFIKFRDKLKINRKA
jgi:hypothetical protein